MQTVNDSYIKSIVRNLKDGGNIQQAKLSDLATFLKADNFSLKQDNEERYFLQLVNSKTGDFINIYMGKSVETAKFPKSGVVPHIINTYKVYTGSTDRNGNTLERPWVRFGKEGNGGIEIEVMDSSAVAQLVANLAKGA